MNDFDKFMNSYPIGYDLVDSNAEYYITLNNIANNIKELYPEYLVRSSCGQGRLSDVPWICIFNDNITKKAEKGLYVAILFKSDMTGFYLCLNQGMQTFIDNYGTKGYDYLNLMSNYFREQIKSDDDFINKIDLGVKKGSRGYGYELGSVIAKYYEKDKFDVLKLNADIKQLLNIYNDIYNSMESLTYDEVISNVINNDHISLIGINEANEIIEQELLKESDVTEAEITMLTEISIPIKKKNNFQKLTKKVTRKIDGIQKAKKDARIGLLGEQMVIEYEKNKMILHNREDLIPKIKWVSKEDDSCGYDIISYDFDDNGNEYQIFIEVKTTESNEKNIFFISRNELITMKENSEKYWIYRVYNQKENPIFYKLNYSELNDKFDVKEYNYVVEIK